MNDDLLTVAEVAAALRLHTDTVYDHVTAGRLPAVRLGKRIHIPRSAITPTRTPSQAQPV